MTEPRVFDHHADDYGDVVNAAIGASGETVDFFAQLRADLMRRALRARPPGHVLDFGCGTGRSASALADTFPAARVTGFDPSTRSIAVAQRRVPDAGGRVRFVAGEGTLPFPPSTFDVVFTSCVFHHIVAADRPGWLAEIRRVLLPGGLFFLFEHNPYNPLTRRVVARIPFDRDAELLRPSVTAKLLGQAGFTVAPPRFYFFFPHALRGLRRLDPHLSWLPLGAQYYVVGTRRA